MNVAEHADQEARDQWRRHSIRATAFHEAGHAVVAAALGRDVYEVWTDGEGGGEVQHRGEKGQTPAAHKLAILLAGPCAEAILIGEIGEGWLTLVREGVARTGLGTLSYWEIEPDTDPWEAAHLLSRQPAPV